MVVLRIKKQLGFFRSNEEREKAIEEKERQERVGGQLPIIQEEKEGEIEIFSEDNEEEIREQKQDNNQQETNESAELSNENAELGWGTINIEEIQGYVEEDFMELREEQVQIVKKGEEKEKKVLTTLSLFEEIIAGQFQSKRKEIKM